jgi:hypothetical protein
MNKIHKRFKPSEANEEYGKLTHYAQERAKELAPMLKPYVEATDKYGRLLSRLCLIIGEHEPMSVQDAVIRDLMADVFDFLYESRLFILKGQTLVAFPLARRAYESMSLLHWCAMDAKAAESWAKGKKVSNQEVRKALAAHPMGEPEDKLQELYKFFCEITHPNREMIAHRGIGEGNRYVFGSIDRPNLIVLADYCMKHLELWFWLCPTVAYFYREQVFRRDPTFHDAHNNARAFAQDVTKWLAQQFNRLLEEWRHDPEVVKPKVS